MRWTGIGFFAIAVIAAPTYGQVAPGGGKSFAPSGAQQSAASAITETGIAAHIQFLADDLLEGRGPGSRGDDLAQLYIETQFKLLGLQPAAPDGSWIQKVPLIGVTTQSPAQIEFKAGGKSVAMSNIKDYVLSAGHPADKISIANAEVVFVGYGIDAPEYDWNDYKDVDLKGKILLMMNNDPSTDPNLFEGRRRLYYGRWDYKYAMAAKMGAIGAFIIHTTESAGYPYQVVQTSWSGESFELRDGEGPRTEFDGWLQEDAAKSLVKLAGKDLDALRAAAESREFQPVPLGVSLSVELTCITRQRDTANVLGLLPGSDPDLSKEVVVYMAHHDHLGLAAQRDQNGDNIYNGAIDNASGSASLLAMAVAYSKLSRDTPEATPKRSILFAAVGAEEQGLLGSEYLAAHPPMPAGNLAAVLNMDGINFLGRTHDVNVIGLGKSNLDELVSAVTKWQNRIVTPDNSPDKGYYYRSDQFSLAKVGVPGVYLHAGIEVVGKPDGWGKQQLEDWVEKTYHQPSDEYQDDWNLEGGVEDVQLLFYVGDQVANQVAMPEWLPGDEFEAARKAAIESRNNE